MLVLITVFKLAEVLRAAVSTTDEDSKLKKGKRNGINHR